MKQFFQRLRTWWFATMTPTFAPLTTIEARETMRKRHLLSLILLTAFFGVCFSTVLDLSTQRSGMHHDQDLLWIGLMLSALWINRCGYLKGASLFYLLGSLVGSATEVVNLSLTLSMSTFYFWSLLLIFPVAAGLFLPAWGPLLLGAAEDAFLCWFVLYERHSQITLYQKALGDQIVFLCIICLVTTLIATFSALSSAITKKAVIQADRADELEQLHQTLSQTHAGLEAAYVTIQKQALTDGLTGLPNHRAIMDQLTKELERAQRYSRPFSLLFLDADRFKYVNDTFGHAAGDTVLHQIGERAGTTLRGGDTLGRIGGEEFVILLPEADAREASIIAERIRAIIMAEPLATAEVAGGLMMTVSIGLSTYPVDGVTEQALLSQADEAMYVAKRLGRNQVRTAEEARKMGTDTELMELLYQEDQREAAQREGIKPEQLRETYTLRMIYSLLSLLERRDEGLCAHAHAVSELATSIAERMGLPSTQVSRIGTAALLHDIGKIALPDRLLEKPGTLSSQERTLLREHAVLGAQILEASPFLCDLMPAVRHHHERWDGSGYPDQMRGEDIPLPARIIAVAEAFDAMQSEHPYQTSCSPKEAITELQRCAGTQFDPEIVQALASLLTLQQSVSQHSPV